MAVVTGPMTQVGNLIGVAVPAGKNINGGDDADAGFAGTGTAFDNLFSIRNRLNTLNSSLYTQAYVDKLSYNDCVYALVLAGG